MPSTVWQDQALGTTWHLPSSTCGFLPPPPPPVLAPCAIAFTEAQTLRYEYSLKPLWNTVKNRFQTKQGKGQDYTQGWITHLESWV